MNGPVCLGHRQPRLFRNPSTFREVGAFSLFNHTDNWVLSLGFKMAIRVPVITPVLQGMRRRLKAQSEAPLPDIPRAHLLLNFVICKRNWEEDPCSWLGVLRLPQGCRKKSTTSFVSKEAQRGRGGVGHVQQCKPSRCVICEDQSCTSRV